MHPATQWRVVHERNLRRFSYAKLTRSEAKDYFLILIRWQINSELCEFAFPGFYFQFSAMSFDDIIAH